MGYFFSVNNKVVCSPFPRHGVEEQRQVSGFITAAPRANLVPLKVLADYPKLGLVTGDTVYLPLEFANAGWAKQPVKLKGSTLADAILVPETEVYIVERQNSDGPG